MRFANATYAAAFAAAIQMGAAAAAPAGGGATDAKRIVSAFLCTDEYVFRLLPRARIAGLSYLSADIHPVVSTIAGQVKGIPLIRASAEQVLTLHPDLVVTYENTNVRQTQLLRAAGVRVLEVPWAQSLADVRRITMMLGAQLGAGARSEALLKQMDSDLARAHAEGSRPAVRTLIYEPNGYATGGGVTEEILSAAGLQNIGTGGHLTRAGTLPVENVLTLAPELLILNGGSERAPARADLVLRHPALRALGSGTLVARTSLVPLLCPGPWSVSVAPELAAWGRKARTLAAQHRGP
ncbi:MAG TPA: ABC transporter substrate-binding protein [Rhizomicrobium sp.]|nr:ABC transporter substrate-binding protein [Rhizomicrobium sp.]